jgi:hypothetical protein
MAGLRLGAAAVLLAFAGGAGVSACGGAGSKSSSSTPRPAASEQSEAFPKASGQSLQALAGNHPQGPILAPAVSVLRPGSNRFAFGLFDRAKKQLAGAPVALYVANADGSNARGPFSARSESLAVKPRFASKTTSQDADAAKSVYVSTLTFPRTRGQVVWALAQLDGRLVGSSVAQVVVGGRGPPPVGAQAPRIHTPTSPPAPIDSIETRVPPDTMHSLDFADVVGRRPVLLVFSTPRLCMSRTCGPVVDEAQQLEATYGKRMAFIHMEVFKNNVVEQGYRPQLTAWGLQSEPWVFAIDRRGRIAAALEGPTSVREMQHAIEKALRR